MNKKRKKILILIFIFLIVLFINLFRKQFLNKFYSFSFPLEVFLREKIQKIFSFSEFKEIIEENKSLREENRELKEKITELQNLKKENEILKRGFEFNLNQDFNLIMARVGTVNWENDFFFIDKGEKDGLKGEEVLILGDKTLVGIVKEVYKNYSKAYLISHPQNTISGKIIEKGIVGMIKGGGRLKLYFDLVSKDEKIEIGDLIISGDSNTIYSKNLLIGEVKKISQDDLSPFLKIEVAPLFDYRDLNYVFVIFDEK